MREGVGWAVQYGRGPQLSADPSASWDTLNVPGDRTDPITISSRELPKYCLPHLYFRKYWEIDSLHYALWQMPAWLVKSRLKCNSIVGSKLTSFCKIQGICHDTCPQEMTAALIRGWLR